MRPSITLKHNPAKQILPRGWNSLKANDSRSLSPTNSVNAEDHGFNHLSIPTPLPVRHSVRRTAPTLNLTNRATEAQYLTFLRTKLQLTVSFLNLELTHNLSPLRPFYTEPVIVALGQAPMPFSIYMVDLIRDLMDGRAELREMSTDDPMELREGTQKKVNEYVQVWRMVVGDLAEMVPGGREIIAHEMLKDVVRCAVGDDDLRGGVMAGE